jgi:outer membrane protein assembly factor BamB
MAQFPIQNPNWPRYNHDNSNTTAAPIEKQITRENVTTLTQQWFTPTTPGDFIQTQPIVRDGVVYTYSGTTVLTAQRVSDGSIIWQTQLGQATAGSTPLISGNRIYATTDENLTLHAIDATTGVVIWSTIIDPVNLATGQCEVQASISQVENLIIVPVDAGPAEDTSLHVIARPTLNAFEASTGQRVWSVVIDSQNGTGIGVWSTPSYDTKLKLMFFGTSDAKSPPAGPYSDALQARNYLTGELVWNQQYTANDVWGKAYPNGIGNPIYQVDRDLGASPNLFSICRKGQIIPAVAAASKAGIFRAFKRKNGKPLWTTQLTYTPSISGNPGAAAAVEGNEFKGVLYAGFNNDPGPSLTPELYLEIVNGDVTHLNAFLRAIFVGTAGYISAVRACDGKVLWSVGYPSPTFGAPVYANGLVYQGWLNGFIRIFDAETGDLVHSFTTPPISIPPFDQYTHNLPVSVSLPIVHSKLFVPLGNEFGPVGGFAVYGLPSP